jgi:hypothetical protein
LLALVADRPLSTPYQPKASLIRELREMDRRQAVGEPEGNLENAQWAMREFFRRLQEDEQAKALEAAV